jgi:hypothetical protein
MVKVKQYVSYDKKDGRVVSIGSEPLDDFDYIQVPSEKVLSIVKGLEVMASYHVQYSPKTKSMEFKPRYEYTYDSTSVKDVIYELPTVNVEDADITITQDIPNTCWKVEIGKELKKNLKANGIRLNANMMFSITEKGDPNILYKTLFAHLGATINDNYCIIPFTMPFETANAPISIYTSKQFDTYQFKRIYEQD